MENPYTTKKSRASQYTLEDFRLHVVMAELDVEAVSPGLAGAAEESKPQRHTGGQLASSHRGRAGDGHGHFSLGLPKMGGQISENIQKTLLQDVSMLVDKHFGTLETPSNIWQILGFELQSFHISTCWWDDQWSPGLL